MREERTIVGAPRGRGSATSYPKAPAGGARRAPVRWRRLARAGRRAAAAVALAAPACMTTPVTGRSAFNLFPVSQDAALGAEAYRQVLTQSEAPPVTSGPEARMVERVMERLVGAVEKDMGFDWEVTLLQDDSTANAFALPGGKMAVYTGILPITRDETGLAVVMGHEIAHVVARHGTQRMTQSLGIDVVFSLFDTGDYETLARMGTDLLISRPFSRSHEAEADHIGLIYMARAGYDPRAAVDFWERMAEAGGGEPPEFLSTHPSHETRIENLRELMPEALEVYRSSGGGRAGP